MITDESCSRYIYFYLLSKRLHLATSTFGIEYKPEAIVCTYKYPICLLICMLSDTGVAESLTNGKLMTIL